MGKIIGRITKLFILFGLIVVGFFYWSGAEEKMDEKLFSTGLSAEQASSNDNGQVEGVTIERSAVDMEFKGDPPSLLPVETYYGKVNHRSIDEILSSHQISAVSEDITKAFPDPSLGLGSEVKIFRATPITVLDVGERAEYYTWSKDIKDFLNEKNILIGRDDIVDPGPEISLFPAMEIEITRVKFTEIVEAEKIPFKTLVKEDPELLKGNQKIEQEGEAGKREKYYEVRRENGKAVSRQLAREVVAREPVDRVVVKGTKEPPKQNYGEGIATWYDWISGMTAAHNSLPYGTMVKVINIKNGKSVTVRIVDRGIKTGAIVDLSADAFRALAPLGAGVIKVRLEEP